MGAVSCAVPVRAQIIDDAGCPSLPEPKIHVVVKFEPPAYNFDQPLIRLRELESATASAAFHKDQAVGFESGQLDFSIRLQSTMIPGSDGRVCARPSDITIETAMSGNAIYVARELPQNSCGQREILAHEEGHVAIDRQLLADYQPILEKFAVLAVRKLGIVRAADPEEAKRKMQAFLNDQLETAAGEMNKERALRQQGHDSPDEYRRLTVACDGAIAQAVADATAPPVPRGPVHSSSIGDRVPARAPFRSY